MPAINLAQLNTEAARLADLFDEPAAFIRELREMLEGYVNQTLRTRKAVAPGSTLSTYRTPPAVIRKIESTLRPFAKKNPEAALALADELWDENSLETRLLAAYLLGLLPPDEGRLLTRLTVWTQKVRDPNVRQSLLTHSLARLRTEDPAAFIKLIEEWLYPHREKFWSNGLQALLPLINSADFDNLPPVFNVFEAVVEAAPTMHQGDVGKVINALYAASPTETSFFLKQIIRKEGNEKATTMLRRLLPDMPVELRTALGREIKSR